jgi:hypothetical protein
MAQADFPVNPRLTVIEGRTIYKKDFKRWIAICAIKDDYGYVDLKLYEWEWRAQKQEWKVSFANYSIKHLDLSLLLREATQLAIKHKIDLDWFDPPKGPGATLKSTDSTMDLLKYLDRLPKSGS